MNKDIYLRLVAIASFESKENGVKYAKKILPNASDKDIEFALYDNCSTMERVSRINRLSIDMAYEVPDC